MDVTTYLWQWWYLCCSICQWIHHVAAFIHIDRDRCMGSGKTKVWFLQLDGERRGPFPAWQISRYLLLQRLDRHSLVSRDGEKWLPAGELPELQPERRLAIADLPEDERQRLQATELWVQQHSNLFKGVDAEAVGEEAEQGHLQPAVLHRPNRMLAYSVVIALLLAVAAIPYLIPSSPDIAEPQCDAVAAPGVNWSNCLLRGSQLASSELSGAMLRNVNLSSSDLTASQLVGTDLNYANLALSELNGAQMQNALLKGANLRNANLRNANLEGADLSYADLTGAQLEGANLTNARLGYAVWEENINCMPESVGKCLPARSVQ
jgi:hypothetical protein